LPAGEQGEEGAALDGEASARGGRAEEGREGAGDRADERVDLGERLERGVDENVDEKGEGGEEGGQAVDEPGEFGEAERAEDEADEDGFPERESAGDEGAQGGAAHEGVGGTFERLVEDGGTNRDERGAEEGVEEFRPVEGATAGEAETG
jgi:hypothetical protein